MESKNIKTNDDNSTVKKSEDIESKSLDNLSEQKIDGKKIKGGGIEVKWNFNQGWGGD